MKTLAGKTALLVLIGLACAMLFSSRAFAVSYRFSVNGGQFYFSTNTPDCNVVADKYALTQMSASNVASGSQSSYYYWDGSCTGKFHSPGDSVTLGIGYYTNNPGWQSYTQAVVLDSITQDDTADDIGGVPMQRIAVIIAACFMFVLGLGIGKGSA